MKCPNCGTEFESKFCPNCGADSGTAHFYQDSETNTTSTQKSDAREGNYSYAPSTNQKPQKPKWYTRTWFTVFMLIFFFPVGLYLMWKYRTWKKPVKIVITVIIALMVIVNLTSSDDNDVAVPGSEQGLDVDGEAKDEKITSKDDADEEKSDEKSNDETAAPADDNMIDCDIKQFHVKYVSHEVTYNAADTKCLAVYYEFTNNSDANEAFGYNIDAKAFQNGVELKSSLFYTDNDDKTTYSEVQPGATTTVCMAYEIRDDSEVTLEVTRIYSERDKKTMKIKLK